MIRIVPKERRRADVGSVFGRWTVTGEAFYIGSLQWAVAQCKCGITRPVQIIALLSGRSASCGCYQKEVVGKASKARGKNLTKNCQVCGKAFHVYPSNMDRAIVCGMECMRQIKGNATRTHGQSKTRLHSIWCHMKTRCFCPTSNVYPYYGGRGITVCDEWRNSYEAFRDWALGNGYNDALEIDRINTNGNYEPGNCRWATRLQQMSNIRKRKNARSSKFKGVSWCANVRRWRVQIVQPHKASCHLCLCDTELAAALRYDDEAVKLFGEFAMLNFPERQSKQREGRRPLNLFAGYPASHGTLTTE